MALTLDEEWEALAVLFKLQGVALHEIIRYTHVSEGPLYELYVKEGIAVPEGMAAPNVSYMALIEKQILRDMVLKERLGFDEYTSA